MQRRLALARAAYAAAFAFAPEWPFGVDDDVLASTLEQAVSRSEPIPDDYDWWAGLPRDEVA
jgi:hypothetical protein